MLHHLPNTSAAIRSCAELLKPGAPLLLYLYYAFDNRSRWSWQLSKAVRLLLRRLPTRFKQIVSDLIAFTVYWPLARRADIAEAIGLLVGAFPLSYYSRCSIHTMRTEARDRFGTSLEQRFTCAQICKMCTAAGLVDLRFSPRAPLLVCGGVQGGPGMTTSPHLEVLVFYSVRMV